MLLEDGLKLGDRWATLRPEQLKPEQFLVLTKELYGANLDTAADFSQEKPTWRRGGKI